MGIVVSKRDVTPLIDVRSVRATLAAERITHTTYAAACGMSRRYVSRILAGSEYPGELARIKLLRGLAALGLDCEAQHAG
jgi:hypothetical protein